MEVFKVDSDNRFGVIDRLAHYLRVENTDIDSMTIKIHRYINERSSND